METKLEPIYQSNFFVLWNINGTELHWTYSPSLYLVRFVLFVVFEVLFVSGDIPRIVNYHQFTCSCEKWIQFHIEQLAYVCRLRDAFHQWVDKLPLQQEMLTGIHDKVMSDILQKFLVSDICELYRTLYDVWQITLVYGWTFNRTLCCWFIIYSWCYTVELKQQLCYRWLV